MTESLMLRSVAGHDVQVFLDCVTSLDSSNFGFGQACKRGFMKYGQASPTGFHAYMHLMKPFKSHLRSP